MKVSIVNKYFYCFLYLVLSITTVIYSQTIAPQTLVFSKICAGNFNQFDATFNHSGFPVLTTFEVQLSDNLGSFTSPVSTTTLSIIDVSVSQKNYKICSTHKFNRIRNLQVKSQKFHGIH